MSTPSIPTSDFALSSLFSVSRNVIVITGGGTGIGKAIATGFATNGARVYIVGRRMEVLERARKEIQEGLVEVDGRTGQVIPIQGDVSTKAKCFEIAKAIAATESSVDCLINCAGILVPAKVPAKDHNNVEQVQALLESLEDEDVASQSSVNVAGPLFTTIAFAPMLAKAKSGDGNVIVIASIAALGTHKKMGSLTYAISKAGAVNVSAQMASRLIPYNVRVNCICPGIYPSQMTATGNDHAEIAPHVQATIETIPAKRLGSPPDIAGPCIMLASRAGSYMNGALLVVDGGRVMTLSSNM